MTPYALSFRGSVWEFTIRPESMEVSYPARSQATPTLAGAYLDFFGPGIGAIRLSGTTGWGRSGVGVPDGTQHLKRLTATYQQYLRETFAQANPAETPMVFVDGDTGATYHVIPDQSGLNVQRSKASPLVYRFSLSLIVLREISGGHIDARSDGDTSDIVGSGQSFAEAARTAARSLDAATASPRSYQIADGDTLTAVAAQFGVALADLVTHNSIRYPDRIPVGLVVTIP